MSKYNGQRYAEKRAAGLCGDSSCKAVAAPFSRCEKHRKAMAKARTPNPTKRGSLQISSAHVEKLLGYLYRTEPYLRTEWDTAREFISQHPAVFFTKGNPVMDHSVSWSESGLI